MKKYIFNRRDFLKTSLLASLPIALGGFPILVSAKPFGNSTSDENDKILVLVQLQGGNDGLSSIIDNYQYDNLIAVRDNIVVPQNKLLNFHGNLAFHPALSGFKELWDTESLGIIQNVGYPNQNRSHFRSTDIWNSASSAEIFESTGWIGRYYDLNYSDYPNGYPNTANPHPFALTMGKIVSETCEGINSNYSLSLLDPFNPGTVLENNNNNYPKDCYGEVLNFVNETEAQTNAYAKVITEAANAGNNISKKWDTLESEIASKLKNVARLISGGLKTKIYIVQLGGFDTHDNQVVENEHTEGIHSSLLKELSDSICAFQDDLKLLEIDDRVLGITYSEFGRRIRSNSALGTDHGDAAPLFVFGSCVNNQIIGDYPTIDTQVSIEDGVPMQFDFRDIYGTILNRWLGLKSSEVENIIYPEYIPLPLIEDSCSSISDVEENQNSGALKLYPTISSSSIFIEFESKESNLTIEIYNIQGIRVKRLQTQALINAINKIEIGISDIPTGKYFLKILKAKQTNTGNFIKI